MRAKKEITVAVIIGLVIGAIVVGGILRARSALTNLAPSQSPSPTPLPSGNIPTESGLFLKLDTLDNQVLTEPILVVAGQTLPQAYIVINGEAGDSIIVANSLGNFSQEIKLVKGANTILVTAYLEDGTKQELTLTAIYSDQEI